jgi:hypothetical protein
VSKLPVSKIIKLIRILKPGPVKRPRFFYFQSTFLKILEAGFRLFALGEEKETRGNYAGEDVLIKSGICDFIQHIRTGFLSLPISSGEPEPGDDLYKIILLSTATGKWGAPKPFQVIHKIGDIQTIYGTIPVTIALKKWSRRRS